MSEEPFVEDEDSIVDPEVVQRLSELFDAECQARHEMGQEKYGPVKFMTVNSIEEALAEVVDLANYARYTYIKLALLATSRPVEPLVGPQTFINEGPSPIQMPTGFFSYRRT